MSRHTRGILCLLLSAFCFTCMNMAVRFAGSLPSVQKSFFRNLVAMFFAFFMLLRSRQKERCASKKTAFLKPAKGCTPGLLLRSLFGTAGILCNFYAVDHLVLSDATILNKLSPFFAALFSVFLLKERLPLRQAGFILLAFIGSLFVVKPSFTDIAFLPGLIGFCGGVSAGIAYSFVRYVSEKGERRPYIVFFFSAFSCLLTLPFLIFSYSPMSAKQLLILCLAGCFAAGGQFSITTAYAYAPARDISVYDYAQVFFAAAFGFLFFEQIPDLWSILGYGIILSAALLSFFHARKTAGKEI